jgi:hypothetical protein
MSKKALALAGFLLLGGASWAAEVEWVKDLNSAMQQAQKANKKLLIDFYSPT